MSRLQSAIDMICKVRSYTENLLDNTVPDDWFRRPGEGLTHIAWQVGHLAVVEYLMCINTSQSSRGPGDALPKLPKTPSPPKQNRKQ